MGSQFQTNNSKLRRLLSRLNGKVIVENNGGSSIDTCTVQITVRRTSDPSEVYYTSVEDGNIVAKTAIVPADITCVCGSMIVTNQASCCGDEYTGLEPVSSPAYPDQNYIANFDVRPYRITASANEVATLYIDND